MSITVTDDAGNKVTYDSMRDWLVDTGLLDLNDPRTSELEKMGIDPLDYALMEDADRIATLEAAGLETERFSDLYPITEDQVNTIMATIFQVNSKM